MNNLSLLEVSKNGDLIIPSKILKKLKIPERTKLALMGEEGSLLLKKIVENPILEFEELTKEGRKFAKEKGIKNKDVTKLIQKIRGK